MAISRIFLSLIKRLTSNSLEVVDFDGQDRPALSIKIYFSIPDNPQSLSTRMFLSTTFHKVSLGGHIFNANQSFSGDSGF